MEIITSEESKKIDKQAINNYIPGILLMERAGINTVMEIEKNISELELKKVLVVCGPGNNGGDGLAIARLLLDKVKKVEILFCGEEEKLSNDAKINYEICKKNKIDFVDDIKKEYEIIIDAIFGIGLNKKIEGKFHKIIEEINKNIAYKVSVDIASGISSNTGEVLGIAVKSDMTVTFHRAKIGQYLYPGKGYTGNLKITNIGIPSIVNIKKEKKRELIKKDEIIFKKRNQIMHKGEAGKVFVLAGSIGMTGAAYMASIACLRSGAGLVTLGVSKQINSILEVKTNEIMTIILDENNDGTLSSKAYFDICNYIKEKGINTFLIGPGLNRNEETMELVRKLIVNLKEMKIVLDADGLYAIKDDLEIIRDKNIILTPHMGEFKRLIKKDKIENKLKEAEEFTEKYGVNLILKGADTIITNGEKTYINDGANSGMAVGGMGDVLSGIVVGLISQGYDILEAGKIAVFLHSYIGKELLNDMSEEAILPTDIIDNIGKAIKKLKEKKTI